MMLLPPSLEELVPARYLVLVVDEMIEINRDLLKFSILSCIIEICGKHV